MFFCCSSITRLAFHLCVWSILFVQILSLIPKESDGELFEDALARVRRCVGGGNATDDADGDSDLEVVADSFVVNLRCPVSCISDFVKCSCRYL